MLQNIQTSIDVVHILMQENVDYEKIIVGAGRYGEYNRCYGDITLKYDGSIAFAEKQIVDRQVE